MVPRPARILRAMVLRLDSRIPLVWRDPSTLQFGVTEPRLVLRDVTDIDERLISTLARGIGRSGLELVATEAGGSADDAARLLDALAPVLDADRPRSIDRVAVCGAGPTADAIAADLAGHGIAVELGADATSLATRPSSLAVIVAHYVIHPAVHALWLRRDVPHLPVVLGDAHDEVGPIVEPGAGPCLYCLARHRTDADAAWPAIAAQLMTRRAPEPPLVATETAAVAARLVLDRLVAGPSARHTSMRLALATGRREQREWHRHPECACALPSAELRAPRGSGSVAAMHPTRRTVRPTSGSGDAAPA